MAQSLSNPKTFRVTYFPWSWYWNHPHLKTASQSWCFLESKNSAIHLRKFRLAKNRCWESLGFFYIPCLCHHLLIQKCVRPRSLASNALFKLHVRFFPLVGVWGGNVRAMIIWCSTSIPPEIQLPSGPALKMLSRSFRSYIKPSVRWVMKTTSNL